MSFCRVYKRMMGLEPTTFCMARASDVRSRSRAFAPTACFEGLRPVERTRPHPSERRTLPFLPQSRRNPGEGGASGCDVLIRPRPGPDTFVQRVGGEVGAARPDDGPGLGVDPHPGESSGFSA